MKKTFLVALCTALTSVSAYAAYDEVGTIKSVEPIQAEHLYTKEVCEGPAASPVQAQQNTQSPTGSIIGGIAGALLGNQVGGGNGRYIMTAIGAATGAMTGDRLSRQQSGNTIAMSSQQKCRLVQIPTTRVSGFLVSYEVLGRMFQSTFPYDPSQGGTNATIRVSLSVMPR